jgi:transposase InsO family protein
MKQHLLSRYFWPNMEKDIQQEIDNCHQCQVRKKDEKPKALLKPLPVTSLPNQRILADLFGPLKTSEWGKKFILVITDAFTKYTELVAMENKEADVIANHIFNTWICRFGIPAELVTDQGKEFTANVCSRLWEKLKIIHSTTSPRHPQTNSQAEVINKTIAKYLAAFVDESTLEWEPYLPALMFSYNTSYHRSIKTSPFFLTYGVHPNMPHTFNIGY